MTVVLMLVMVFIRVGGKGDIGGNGGRGGDGVHADELIFRVFFFFNLFKVSLLE